MAQPTPGRVVLVGMRNTLTTAALVSIAGLSLTACGGPQSPLKASSAAPACKGAEMSALPAIPTQPAPGTNAVQVSLINNGDYACTIAGAPKAAIGGLSPQPRNLTVTPNGTADPLVLAPGDQAVTVVASAMTADFKCASGGDPTRPPVLLVGVPDDFVAMKMADGAKFTECGDAVTISPWRGI